MKASLGKADISQRVQCDEWVRATFDKLTSVRDKVLSTVYSYTFAQNY